MRGRGSVRSMTVGRLAPILYVLMIVPRTVGSRLRRRLRATPRTGPGGPTPGTVAPPIRAGRGVTFGRTKRMLKKTGMGWSRCGDLGFRCRHPSQLDIFKYPPRNASRIESRVWDGYSQRSPGSAEPPSPNGRPGAREPVISPAISSRRPATSWAPPDTPGPAPGSDSTRTAPTTCDPSIRRSPPACSCPPAT